MFNNFVSPSTVALAQSVEGVLMVITGGVGTLFGALRRRRARSSRWRTWSAPTPSAGRCVLGLTFILHHDLCPRGHHRQAARDCAAAQVRIIEMLQRKESNMDRRQFLKTSTAALTAAARASPWRSAQRAGGADQDRCAGAADRRRRLRRQGDGRGRRSSGLDQVKSEIAGRKVELVIEDDASNPDTALAESAPPGRAGQCDMLIGNLLANTGLAVANYVKGTGTPYFIPIIAADDLTQRQRIKNVIRVAGYSRQRIHPSVRRLGAEAGLQEDRNHQPGLHLRPRAMRRPRPGLHRRRRRDRAAVLASAQHRRLQPLSRPARRPEVDAVFAMETGADATRFIQQYASFGLKAQTPLLAAMNGTDQSVIRTLGEECEGIISPAHFAEGSDNPVTQKFVKEYEAKYGKIPSLYGFSMYSGVDVDRRGAGEDRWQGGGPRGLHRLPC